MKRIITSIVVLLVSFWSTQAQTMITGGCESSPCNAIPLCGIGTVNQANSFTSTGNPQGTCGANFFTGNWVYYRFTCYASGNLTFTITPNDATSDINWGLWDISVTGCGSLSATTTCSAAPTAGAVNSGIIPIVAGNTYILGVQRASGGTATFGFGINFTGTTASLTNSTQPSMASVLPINICLPVNQVKVKLTDGVRCSQVSVNDFNISSNPTFTVGGSSCPGCVNATTPITNYSAYEDTLVFNFPTALAPGTYTISFNSASPNLPRNYCNLLPNTAPTVSFTVPVALDVTNATGYNCTTQSYIDTLQGFNGNPPYQYKVKGGTQANTYGTATNSYNVFTGLVGNTTYTAYVKDANGCEDSVILNHPALIPLQAPNLSLSASPPCYNQFSLDSIVVGTMTSGQGPYTFTLASTPAAAATSGTFYPPNKWKNLQFTAGAVFTVTVTDAWGCTKTAIKNLVNPAQLTLPTPTSTNPLCPGDSNGVISVTATGGTGPWNYLYNPFYPPTMDTNNTSPSHIGNQAVNVPAGVYVITVTDANGCSTTVSRTLTTPPVINIKTNNTPAPTVYWNPTCLNPCSGKIKPSATGGTGTKKNFYLYYPTYPSAPIDSVKYIGVTTVTDSFFDGTVSQPTGLCAGTYTVMAVDQAGCTATATITLSLPAYPDITLDSTIDVNCNGSCTGKIYTSTVGAATPFTYTISPATVGACTATSIGSNTGDYQGLAAGTYTIVVTKTYGADQCKDTLSNITITEPPALQIGIPDIDDVLCFGGNSGEIEILATGGTGTITYTITPLGPQSNTTGEFQNLTAQCYTITATDANGCTITTTACVTQPTQLNLAINNVVNVSCFGLCDGTADAVGSGGASNYQYSITAPGVINASTGAISGLCVGGYTVTVTDDNGCTSTATINITQPNALTAVGNVTQNALCNGDCNGTATITPSGGTSPYNYTIAGPGTPVINASGATGNASALCAGIYTVQVTDANTCTTAITITITEPGVLTAVSALTNNPTCTNACNGGGTVTPAGGTSPYNYTISGPGSPTINASGAVGTALNLCNGVYTIQVTDANSCTTTVTISVTDPAIVTIDTLSVQHALCDNSCNGIITMTAGGGIGGYSYSISPTTNGTCNIAQAANVFSNAWAATYLVTVLDGNACSATMNVTVTDPAPFIIDTISVTPVSCNGGCDGVIEMAYTGGTGLASYNISPSVPCVPTQTIPGLFGNLGSNLYTIQGTDANGCTAVKVVLVSQPSAPTVSITPGITPTCSPGCDGTATAAGSGGVGGFSYTITPNATTSIDPLTGAITNVCAGVSYTVTATDANSCSTTASFLMVTPNGPVASITGYTLPTCNPGCDGTMTVNVSGGTSPYTYNITAGASVSITGPTATTTVTGNNLCAGTNYILTVTDANLCVGSADTLLNAPAPPTVSVSGAIGNVTCNGGCNGTVTITSSGGTGTVTFGNLVWQNPAMTCVPQQPTSGSFTNLGANTYTITGTDASGCTGTVSFTITEPTALTLAVTSTQDVDCNGNCTGIINFVANGGTPGYNYSINPNTNGTCNATLVGSSYTTLWASNYTVSVSDGNGCVATSIATINENPVFSIDTLSVTPVSCNGGCDGAIEMVFTGGSGTATYSISPNVPCVPTQPIPGNFGNLGSNLYTVQGIDGNGCIATTNVMVNQPSAPTLGITPGNQPGCNPGCDGTAQANAGGGTPGYTYSITGSATISATGAITHVCANVVYTVTATDVNGCTSTASFSMTTAASPTLTLTGQINPTCTPGCDGTAQANPLGGAGGYTYSVTGGASVSTTGLVSGICAGVTYTVTLTDANGCTATSQITMTTPNGPVMSITSFVQPSCSPGCNGSMTVSVSGGTAPFTYSINAGAGLSVTGPTAATVTTGTNLCDNQLYTLTVTDANSCVGFADTTLFEPAGPTVDTVSTTPITCFQNCNGTVVVTSSGGAAPINFSLTPVNSSPCAAPTQATATSFTGLGQNSYIVQGTDANGCTGTFQFTMNQPTQLTTDTVSTNDITCNGNCNGQIVMTSSGGTPPYNYTILPITVGTCNANVVGNTISNLGAATYTVTAHDANNCTVTKVVTLTQPAVFAISAQTLNNVTCNALCTGSAVMTYSGGTPPVSYTILPAGAPCPPAQTVPGTFTNLGVVTYTVQGTDALGCTSNITFTLTQPGVLGVNITPGIIPSCGSGCNGTAQANGNGGTPGYTYQIAGSPSVTINTNTGAITGVCSGIAYTVTVTDANLCTSTQSFTMTTPGAPTISVTNTTTPTCTPGCDGTASVNVVGGTLPLTYTVTGGATMTPAGPTNNLNSTANNLCASTNYTITVTDANACSGTTTVNIAPPVVPVISQASTTPVSCTPGCDGSITMSPVGLTYTVTPGGSVAANVISNLCAGTTYTIVGTNTSNCKDTFNYTPTAPLGTPFNVTSTTPPTCNPGCDGTATMSNPALVYTVNPAGPTAAGNVISNICANTIYTIIGTDATNCTNSVTVQLFAPNAPVLNVTATTNPTSAGASNGTIQVGPIVAGSSYSITPNGPQTNATGLFVGLDSNCYTITVTNAQGCTATTTTCLDDPGLLSCTINYITHVSCFGGNNGTYDMDASGGFGTLTFSSNPAGVDPVTGSASGLSAGSYTVTVTDQNANTCTQVMVINQPALLGFNLPAIVTGTCTNPCSGSITINATGGTAPYTYSIQSPAGGCTASQANPNVGNFTNIGTGTYTINVIDFNSCTASITVIVAPPTNPTINAVGLTDVLCNGACNGQIIINATGAVDYSRDGGANYQASNTFNAVCAGTYTVVAKGANGCTASSVVIINEPPVLAIDSTPTVNVLCAGGNTGSITVYASGGSGGYQYSSDCTIYQASNTFNNLVAGTYTLCVKDANNCTQSTVVTITQPTAMSWVFALGSDLTCNGSADGSISVQAQGGTGTIEYSLNSAAYSLNSNYTNLAAGQYTITAKDQNNCIISTFITLNEPPALGFNVPTVVNNLCFGTSAGSISISAFGGVPYVNGYTYTLSPMPAGATQTSPGYFQNLPAGTYAVTVFDSVGCSQTYVPNIAITQPPQLILTLTQKIDIECFGAATGLIDVDGSGGTGAVYTYQLMPNNITNQTGNFGSLTAGTYTLYVIDQNNCTASILVSLNQPPPVQVATVIPTEPVCHGDANGAINIIAQGGQPPYQYSLDGGPLQPSGLFTGLVSKVYLITIVDSKGCQHQENYFLTEPDFVGAILDIRDAKCIDSKDGRIEITGTGGRGGYSYYIMPGLLFNKSGLFTNLEPGLYHLTVKDTAGCTYLTDFTINPPANPLGVTITKKDLGCTGKGFEGQATANVFGGQQPFTYLWFTNPIQTDAVADSLYYGWYQLQVADAYGCVVKDSVYIEEGPCCDVSFIPNAFSPNGDGNNDVFRVLTTAGVELQQLEVYDRWGKRVWSTNNYRFGWDGTIDGKGAEVGTYYFVFRYKCTRDQLNYVKKGDLILVR
ncbi:MAG: gliding motility-associated C-terminal domain-containing protein [Chitinophagaceae bacterium]|nr:gliding motility-associated C-terminal domain-containing protein [Chitinophagaceae bacterium]